LLSAIHPEFVSPECADNTTDLTLKDLIKQESFLYHKYLEFTHSDLLRPLLDFSRLGDTDTFISYFNSLSLDTTYGKFKICLYDINQRRLLIDPAVASQETCKKVFLVHYNGYVFGTNHAKMFTIREREIGLHESSSSSSSDEEFSEEVKVES
jgi:hypothetical protein